MSNCLSIEVVESRVAGSKDPFEFSIIASDSYGSAMDKGYASMETLLEAYPSRLEVLEWLVTKPEFAGAFSLEGSKVVLDAVSYIDFAGYPEDDSIASMERE